MHDNVYVWVDPKHDSVDKPGKRWECRIEVVAVAAGADYTGAYLAVDTNTTYSTRQRKSWTGLGQWHHQWLPWWEAPSPRYAAYGHQDQARVLGERLGWSTL